MSRSDRYLKNLSRLLTKYLDPTQELIFDEYLYLAKYLLTLLRDNKLEYGEYVKNLLKLCRDVIINNLRSEGYREKFEKALKGIAQTRIEALERWIKLGIQMLGLEAPSITILAGSFTGVYIGLALKLTMLAAAESNRYMSYRFTRKIAVKVETLVNRMGKEVDELEKAMVEGMLMDKLIEEMGGRGGDV